MACILSLFFPVPPIALQIDRDQKPIYMTDDHILGHIILELKAPVNISQITVTLSGRSISRLDGSEQSQSHQFLRETQQIFPKHGELDASGSKSRTMGPKQYVFPFLIAFPQKSECYKTHRYKCWGRTFRAESSELPMIKSREIPHRFGQLPPRTGNRSSTAEIVYSLDASVVVDGIFKPVIKKSQQVSFSPIVSSQQPRQPPIQRREVFLRYHDKDNDSAPITTAYQVVIELTRGDHLIVGQRVPINVHVTQADPASHDLILNDYQAILVQETRIHVGKKSHVQRLFQILRTVSNLNLATCLVDKPLGTAVTLSDDSWGVHSVPHDIAPTFEVCNISRNYKLDIRLGFKGGQKQAQTRILEVQFPVNIVSTASALLQPTRPLGSAR